MARRVRVSGFVEPEDVEVLLQVVVEVFYPGGLRGPTPGGLRGPTPGRG